MSDPVIYHPSLRVVQTCGGFPERYDVIDDAGKIVGDLYLRMGDFTATAITEPGVETEVYWADPEESFGSFGTPEIRDATITKALAAIGQFLGYAKRPPEVFTLQTAQLAALLDAAIEAISADEQGPEIAQYKARRAALTQDHGCDISPADLAQLLKIAYPA
jgi:hypothetical protein